MVKKILPGLLNTESILFKLVSAFLLLILVPAIVIGAISTSSASRSLIEKTEESIASSTMQTSNYFDLILNKMENISYQAFSSNQIQQYAGDLSGSSDELARLNDGKAAADFVRSLVVPGNSEYDVNILYESGEISGNMSPQSMDGVRAAAWYKEAVARNGEPVWVNNHDEGFEYASPPTSSMSMVRALKSSTSSNPLGVILLDVAHAVFSSPLSNIRLGEEDSTYLIASTGKVLSSGSMAENDSLSQRPFIKKVLEYLKTNDKGIFYIDDGGVNYLVSYFKSGKSGWTAVSIIPKAEITAGVAPIRSRIIVSGLIFAVLAVMFGFVFSYRLTSSIRTISLAMEKAKNGDLTIPAKVKRRDEIGRLAESFRAMMENIRELIMENRGAAAQVGDSSRNMNTIARETASAASEIARSVGEMASGASNLAVEVEGSVSSISNLAQKINTAVEGVRVMGNASAEVEKLTSDGLQTIETLHGMAARTDRITESVVIEINQLNEYVKNINKITNILNGIADETNLLALNAAIEAARAGDAGKGFAVVADEVRKLAEQSNNFTKDIQGLVAKILKQAQNSADLVHKAGATIKEQSGMVDRTADVFSKIDGSTLVLAENIAKMADIISDMDTYKEQVLSRMENMSAVSEETAASTEEVSATTQEQLAAVEELDRMANNLNDLAEKLIVSIQKFSI